MTSALDQFADRPLWVLWRSVRRGHKATKVPYALDGRPAKSDDPTTWCTRAQAERHRNGYDGVGIMLARIDDDRHLGGIDLDACINDEGDVAPWAREIVELFGSYTEVSPSGHGLKIFFEHDPRETLDRRWRSVVRLMDSANLGAKLPAIEVYLRGRYFTVTDRLFESYDTVRPCRLDKWRALQDRMEAFGKREPRRANNRAARDDQQRLLDAIGHMPNHDLHWEEWNTQGMAIFHATGGSAQGYGAFVGWSAKASKFDPRACDERWQHWHHSPPDHLTAGTIFHEAKAAGWRDPRPRPRNGHDQAPPPPADAEPTGESAPNEWAAFGLEVERLARLNMLAYQRERKDVATRFNVPLPFLDKQVEAARNPPKSEGVPEVVPWPEPVDGASLLDEIKAAVLRHMKVPTRAEEAIALWIVFTHCLDAVNIAPQLAITSPTHECGKSTLVDLITTMVAKPLPSSSVSAAVVYRSIEKWHPTLLLDEVDAYLPENEALRGILNSAHRRSLAFVLRSDGDDNEPRRFSTWCALLNALTGKLPPSLASRSIHIELQRKRRGEFTEPLKLEEPRYASLGRKAARWAADNMDALRGAKPELPEGFMNRRADNWLPLLAIADQAGSAWPVLAREAALTLNHVDTGQDLKITLLEDIKAAFGDASSIFSKALAEHLAEMEGRPWPEFGRSNKPITPNAIARLLKPLMIFPTTLRDGDELGKGYLASDFADAFQRYLSPEPPAEP